LGGEFNFRNFFGPIGLWKEGFLILPKLGLEEAFPVGIGGKVKVFNTSFKRKNYLSNSNSQRRQTPPFWGFL